MTDQEEGSSSDSVECSYQFENQSGKTLNSVYVRRGKPSNNVNGYSDMDDDEDQEPYIEILEQPQPRGFRFRYECEGPSHGGLQGERSEKYRKTFPAIKIRHFNGPARVVVTLVTDEDIPRPHAHKLVGKNCYDGTCIVELKTGQSSATFPNLCVQHVTRRKASEVIEQRILESIKLDKLVKLGDLNAKAELTESDVDQAKKQASKLAKDMQLNVVRLCFQAYLRDENGQFSRLLQSVLSNPIYDSKSPGANALKICRMDKYGGCCTGNEEVFLLCEKVQKDDIAVRFVEQDDDGNVIWEEKGNFGPFDVHRQYAIVFKTPAYKDTYIERAVNVLIQLQRLSDGETSDPKSFTYYPQNMDKEDIARKRRKALPSYPGGGPFGSSGTGGRPTTGTNGFSGGTNSCSTISQGNLPIMVNQDNDVPMTERKIINSRKGKGRPKAKPQSDLEEDCTPLNPQIPTTFHFQQQNFGGNTEKFKQPPVQAPPISFTYQQSTNVSFPAVQQYQTSVNNMNRGPHFTIQTPPFMALGKDINLQHTSLPLTSPVLLPRGGGEAKVKEVSDDTSKANSGKDETDGVLQDKENLLCPGNDSVDENVESNDSSDEEDNVIVSDGDTEDKSELLTYNDKQKHSIHRTKCHSEGNYCRHVCVQTEGDSDVKVAEKTAKAIQMYAATGDIRQLLIIQRYLSYIADEAGDLPLHTCIINRQLEVVHNLLDIMTSLPDARRKINAHNRLLQTPLHLAVLTGQVGVIDLLLQAGAEPTILDRNGNTAAHLAVLNGENKCLSTLLKYLRPGLSYDQPFPELDIKNLDGLTPIHIAAKKQDITAMKLLVHGKADVNMPDGKCGRTALHIAANVDNLSMAGWLLLEAHAAVNAQCFDGNTALHIACGQQNIGMVALLMAEGADPKITNYDTGQDSDSENMNDESSDDTRLAGGRTPEDFAMDNEKVLKVLCGHPYTSISEIHKEAEDRDYRETTSIFTSLVLASGQHKNPKQDHVRFIADGGDMDRVTYPVRVQLSKLLDPRSEGRDWQALSHKLGFSRILQDHSSGHSPTRLLLTYFEECGGTIRRLVDALVSIQRQDAINLIASQVNIETESLIEKMSSIELNRIDSNTAAK